MSSFEIGASRPVGAVQLNTVQPAAQTAVAADSTSTTPASTPASTTAQTSAAAEVQTSLTVSAGTVPVDQTRVDQIRKAVQNGTYPLVPTKIGDAMVAAGLMLRKKI
jgi:negative regulator of flagellin synthesis FlgM